MTLSFVQLNIESNYHLDRLEAILRTQPDVLCLQEVFLANLKDLAPAYGYHYAFSRSVIFDNPAGKFAPLGEWGIAILTKEPQHQVMEQYYAKQGTDVRSELNPPPDHPRSVLSVTIQSQGQSYTFATTHFTWAMPADADRVQASDLQRLLPLLDNLGSFVLSGDFNAPQGSLVHQTLSAKYLYHLPPSVTTTIDNQLHRAAPLNLVVDHLFSTADYRVTDVAVRSGYSDHCAIFATIARSTT